MPRFSWATAALADPNREAQPQGHLRERTRVLHSFMRKIGRPALVAAVLALVAVPVFASTAAADMFFHTSHAELTPIGDAPLKSGFVNDMHSEGEVNAAHEVYQLNGALPNTDYVIMLHIYGPDATCTGDGRAVVPTTISTNAAGNGQAIREFAASTGPPRPPTTTHIRWIVTLNGTPVYQTGCVEVISGTHMDNGNGA
jgi:hypothetical protein